MAIYKEAPQQQQLLHIAFRQPTKKELLWRKALGLDVYTGKSSSALNRFLTTAPMATLTSDQTGTRAEGNIKAEKEAARNRLISLAKLNTDLALLIISAGTFGGLGTGTSGTAAATASTAAATTQNTELAQAVTNTAKALMGQAWQQQQQTTTQQAPAQQAATQQATAQQSQIDWAQVNQMIPLVGNVISDIAQVYYHTVNVPYDKYNVFAQRQKTVK